VESVGWGGRNGCSMSTFARNEGSKTGNGEIPRRRTEEFKGPEEVVCGVNGVGDGTGKLKNRRNLFQALLLGYSVGLHTRTGVGGVLILCRRGSPRNLNLLLPSFSR
jgi:hypothetical protein